MEMIGYGFGSVLVIGCTSLSIAAIVALIRSVD